ncbi:malonate decarboxylase holo-[acyl-carrier-protein] synthase [Xanthobacter sp. DSM 24535]|uniref:malonate decarboxylase holo-[acyl-carrier-protein] synthase n=1 Tax=Roseixanthobacter psychrophilus TaxID=3119917 RepID=UPI003728B1C0
MPDRPLARHDLVHVTPQGWRAMLDAVEPERLGAAPYGLVEDWAERGWPVIVRRPSEHGEASTIAVGLPLPPSHGKLRLGFTIAPDCVAERLARVQPSEVVSNVPASLHAQLDAVIALGVRLSVTPAVFGAVLWQHLTGLTYLRPGSDIDLLWPLPYGNVVPELLAALAILDEAGPARLDGEIILADGAGVNWRELHSELGRTGGEVLVKSLSGAEFRCARHLFA